MAVLQYGPGQAALLAEGPLSGVRSQPEPKLLCMAPFLKGLLLSSAINEALSVMQSYCE